MLKETVLDLEMSRRGDRDAEPPQTGRTHEDQERGGGLATAREVLEPLPNERSAGKAIEIHGGIIGAVGRGRRGGKRRDYAQSNECFDSGSDRIRFPVAAKMALQSAGTAGGKAGSPRPVGGKSVFTNCTSTGGA